MIVAIVAFSFGIALQICSDMIEAAGCAISCCCWCVLRDLDLDLALSLAHPLLGRCGFVSFFVSLAGPVDQLLHAVT